MSKYLPTLSSNWIPTNLETLSASQAKVKQDIMKPLSFSNMAFPNIESLAVAIPSNTMLKHDGRD
jgi:hypothetical protein